MSRFPWRLACSLAFLLPTVLLAQVSRSLAEQNYFPISSTAPAVPKNLAQSFLFPRSVGGQSPALSRLNEMQQRTVMPDLLPGNQPWQAVGPAQIVTSQFGDVTGRVTSIAIAPWDASGNTVYLGSTGGGVWRSTNAAASDPSTVMWQPLTDDPPAYSGVNITSLSIGAVSVQPSVSPDGVVLAGTGDPNDVVDSYYGAGILRSTDGGTTWSLITESQDGFAGGLTNYSFAGDAFSGFAWSTINTNLVVAAVTDSYDGFVNNVNNVNTDNPAEAGLYYSTDAGQTWFLSTIEDGPNQVIQSSQDTLPQNFPGVPVSSVVWNPMRQMFYAAVQYHGYYQSPDGITWTRLANQPGTALTTNNCPPNPGFMGSNSCTIFRGVLAVQPLTGDMFALAVDVNNVDQGLWQDVCNVGSNGSCANPVQFGVRIPDAALEDSSGQGTIPQGTYNLALAAVPNGTDTLLFAGTTDIFRCSLNAGCAWRDTTNAATCDSGKVAAAQHAMAFLAPPAGQTLPLIYFGNDGGIWRSTDGVSQGGAACAASDAAHYENLNGGLGSLAEVTGLASNAEDANVLLAGFGVNGSAATANLSTAAWPQLLSGEGGLTAIDLANPNNWYATLLPGVAIGQCMQGANCAATDFGSVPAIGSTQTGGDQSLLYAPYLLDTSDSANMLVGTCRVWRGPANGGSTWTAANAISPMLDGNTEPSCNGNALIRSLGAGGANMQPGGGTQNDGAQVIYAGMAGLLDGGGAVVGGHLFSTRTADLANSTTQWTDLATSPVTNEQSYGGVFNPYHFDVSSVYVDPHDATGNTVYVTIQGFGVPHLYLSTDGGTNWNNITKNLPDLPLNDVLVDPNDASVVYVASDGGVFVTQNVANCEGSSGQCWNMLGTGLPLAPAVALAATPADGGLLRVGTYGRGIWQTPLLSGIPQTTMQLTPSSLTFSGQPLQTASSPQTVTVTNTGSASLMVSNIAVTGDFFETDTCSGTSIAPGGTCQIQVTFTPSATGTRTGALTVTANITGGQQSIALTGTGTTQSAIVVMPSNVTFGGQQVGTTSAAQQVTVSNTSSGSILLTQENVTGPFAISINSCSSTLDANTGCTLAIVFQPTQSGTANGMLTIVSGQGTQNIDLSGSGETSPTDTLAPSSLSFPATLENTASAPQSVTLTNSGGAPLTGIQVQTNGDFAVVNGCGYSLNAQSACTLTVRYTPHAAGAETGSITMIDALRTQTVSLSGIGLAPPTDTLSPAVLVFPATVIGHNAQPQTVMLTNSGDSALNQISIRVLGGGFGESNTCGSTLAAHSTCMITATFQPISAGIASGQIDVADAVRTQIVSLSGSGETPAEDNLSPLAINFGSQTVGTVSAAQTVTLSNNGQAQLTGIREQTNNPDFMFITSCGATLQPGNSCTIQVVFVPHTTGPDTGVLTVIDTGKSQPVQLNGIGTLANITLTSASVNFGAVGIQISSPPQTLLLANGSTGTMSGISITMTGPYAETSSCGTILPSGSTCSISLIFSPRSTGNQAGTLTIHSADVSPMTAPLTGTGIAFTLSPTSATSVSVTSGEAASYSLELMPTSGSIGNATVTCANLPPNSTCTASPATPSLLAPTNIQVAIATGVATATSNSVRMHRAGGTGSLPWPLGLLLVIVPLWLVHCRGKALQSSLNRVLTIVVLAFVIAGMSACGKGGGPLGVGAPNPLPGSSLTPAGTYTIVVTASAGGLQKSVNLTVQVQ